MRYALSAILLCAATCCAPCCALADIVLDEFIDAAMATSPAMENNFVETINVGDLSSQRRIRIAGSAVDPIGQFDINVSSAGRMTIQIDEIRRTSAGLPLSAPQFNYYFNPTDVTEDGKNDAILFDFVELVGDVQPTFLRAIVADNTHLTSSFEIRLEPLVANPFHHTLTARFDEFTFRGGSPGLPDPTTLKQINFDFFFLGHHGELNWSARLERIRFGVAVPEPSGILLLFVASAVWSGSFRFRKGARHVSQELMCMARVLFHVSTGDRNRSCE